MVKCSSGSRIFECKHGEMQLRIQNIRPIFPAPLMITSILCKNTPKWGDFIYTPQSPQTPHFGVIYMRIAPHTPQCTSIAIPHKPQSSILSSQSSLYPKSGVLLSLYPKYPKWGTSGVHKRGLTRFLDLCLKSEAHLYLCLKRLK